MPSLPAMTDPYAPRAWLPHERPMMPGSPSTPLHAPARRAAYAAVGLLVSLTGGLGNALVSANLQSLQGALGLYAAEAAWLPAAFVMSNVSMNLLLVKFRQQYGLRLFTEAFIALYALIALAHVFVHDFSTALALRAAHGMTAAAMTSLGLYYMLQAFPAPLRLRGLVIALGTSQLALPLARLLPVGVLEASAWRGLTLFEAGLALLSFAAVLVLKLPPGDRYRVFEKLDFLTFALFAPGMALLCAVLGLGRTLWWTQSAWLGWALAGAIVLLTAAVALEHHRRNPLLNTRWISSAGLVRLGLVMLLIRVVLSEQGVGAVGLLQTLGMGPDQLRPLFVIVLLGTVAGVGASAWLISPTRLHWPILFALALMILGSLLDAQVTSLARPHDFYVSQFLLAFGSAYFLGPAMLSGMSQVIAQPRNLVSFTVIFGISQNLGGLAGSALVGTFQTWREKFHSSQLTEPLTLLDPQVVARLQAGAAALAGTQADPVLRNAQGSAALAAAAAREANVLAYADVFLFTGVLAALTLVFMMGHAAWAARRGAPEMAQRTAQAPAPAAAAPSPAPAASPAPTPASTAAPAPERPGSADPSAPLTDTV
ncbi:MFS transporter [Azohydromonas lata]|uniref:MFS transporter n=1 Tax=Azohydromonas lata TaxID=45677 RepID=A0ABU5IHV0_9BURK|nr:MFS transporter [Azohydromonas lata]MDZ5458728.1 MFS transporter [Azohydromonas lata]